MDVAGALLERVHAAVLRHVPACRCIGVADRAAKADEALRARLSEDAERGGA